MDQILRLYPLPAGEVPLVGAYLALNLRQHTLQTGKPFLYANFIASLDGRIAIQRPNDTGFMVPKAIANERDWRLYQELAAQADIVLSSGRYLRDWAEGRAQEILQIDDPRFADLRAWRLQNGLPAQADIAIISGSLDFLVPPVLFAGGRRVVIVTTGSADRARVKEIETLGGRVMIAGEKSVDGALLVQGLAGLGYRTIYSAAGPRINHLLVTGGMLDKLYLTSANLLLGGQPYSSILEGPLLTPPVGMKIHHVYLDTAALNGLGQMYIAYGR